MNSKILITGASGFIARSIVCYVARSRKYEVSCLTRHVVNERVAGAVYHPPSPEYLVTDFISALVGIDVVVHCAARAHVITDRVANPLAAFRAVNVNGTLNLAAQAARAGVKRFVFISSIGVNGLHTDKEQSYTENDYPFPHNDYALSKWEAEQGLLKIARETGLEVVIIRPPLVYGPNAPGNFGSLMNAVKRGLPLPLGAIHNQRSLVALDNLVDFIITCINHPNAANQTFLVSDGHDLSTFELIRTMAKAAGVPARLIPVPVPMLQLVGKLLGKGDAVQRLCGNLQVDISKARNLLNWSPPISVEEGIRRAMMGSV